MDEIQVAYKLALIFLYSLCSTLWFILPYVKRKLTKYGHVVQDKYKKKKVDIPTMGGIAILGGMLVSLSLSQIFDIVSPEETFLDSAIIGKLFIFYFIVIIYAMYGIVDDLFKPKKRYDKLIVILVMSFPIASLIADTRLNLLLTDIELGAFYALIIAPIYIMVVANLVNLHSGYNGLAMGNAWLILLAIGIKSYMQNGITDLIFLMPVFGALTAFLPQNLYPAKMLEGNTGSFLVGGAIGALLLIQNLEWFGIFILIPHIINFIMDTWTILFRKNKDVKYGKLRKDGTIEAPASMKYKSLKFWVVSAFRLSEKNATLILQMITLSFCVAGILLF